MFFLKIFFINQQLTHNSKIEDKLSQRKLPSKSFTVEESNQSIPLFEEYKIILSVFFTFIWRCTVTFAGSGSLFFAKTKLIMGLEVNDFIWQRNEVWRRQNFFSLGHYERKREKELRRVRVVFEESLHKKTPSCWVRAWEAQVWPLMCSGACFFGR